MSAPAVLVTDGEQRAALAVVRSLGHAGHPVYVCAARPRPLAGASRWCRDAARVADPLSDPEAFVRDVRELVRRWRVGVLLPIADPSLLALLDARDESDALPDVVVPFPDARTFRRISNKAELLALARCVGIATPDQRVIASREHAAEVDAAAFPLPVVLKPARSVGEHAGRRAKLGVRHAAAPNELSRALAEFPPQAFPLLVQQRIEGPGIGIFLLTWEGRTLAAFAHRRLREKPPSGGVSVYRESVAADPALVARSRALLDQVGWCGVAMIEYKVDAETGVPYLMEVNGRFWGSLQLAIDAGVDFPLLLVRAALGADPEPVVQWREHVRSRWEWGEVDHLLSRLRRSAAELALPADAPGRWRAVRDFLTVRRGDRAEVLRRDDPRPFLRETLQWLRRA